MRLTADDEGLLRSSGTPLHYSRGDVLARKDTTMGGLIIVRNGRVRLELNDRRGACALAIMEPIHIIGEGVLLGGEREHLSIFAEDEVEAEVIDGRVLREMVGASPAFAARLFRAIASVLADRCAQMARTAAPPLGWE